MGTVRTGRGSWVLYDDLENIWGKAEETWGATRIGRSPQIVMSSMYLDIGTDSQRIALNALGYQIISAFSFTRSFHKLLLTCTGAVSHISRNNA